MSSPVFQEVAKTGVVAVLVIDRAEDAVPLARALLAGGLNAMELTLRTEAAIPALERIRTEVPEMIAGIGTILSVEQARAARQSGAAFGVAPGLNPRVVAAAAEAGLPFAPGIATPTEIERALELGCRVLKFFPAEPIGGLPYLQAVAAPYAHLGVSYMPLGGVSASNMGDYLRLKFVAAIGGSWIASRELIQRNDWAAITSNAQQAMALVKAARA